MKKEINGVFDGNNMMLTKNGKMYPIPPNYASKSKLVEGDEMVLKINKRSGFVFKQIKQCNRKRLLVEMKRNNNGRLIAEDIEGNKYNIASTTISYFKLEEKSKVSIITPSDTKSACAAIEMCY